ncbi:DMT family transporter [Echinicola jeungdonensis]|uniref:DMT family transporter n=1 Tax=Echinicola jeungdonensis TaxID=709343 RepID=A0ABV5J798_9BACT|nr:DMT family transporter [Echinicola jeungdonensis]MDN3670979.1 DMT family transporter [Echinicola jeungdonensis]
MLLAGIFFALMQVLVKYIPHLPAVEIVFFRSLISMVATYLILKRKRVSLFGNNKKLLMIRGASGALALIMFFYTLQNVPLASAVTLQYLSPIFTAILGIFIAKEKIKPIRLFYFALAFGGVLIIQGFDPRMSMKFLLIGVGSAFFAGTAYNIIRKLKGSEHPLVIVFYFPLVTLPIVGVWSYFKWVMPSGWDWLILAAIGTFTQMAQYYMTLAYQHANLAKIASLNYIGIVYALIFGFIFFGETFNLLTYLGMGLVLLGVILNIQSK